MPPAPPWQYEKLTWPQINEAIKAGKVPVIPVGSIEQHGPHLPLDVDCVCPRGVCEHAAELIPDTMLLLPTLVHGYTGHVMDFPGTINLHYEHLINLVVDVGKSLAYHGFKKLVFVNGHGSNAPNLDLASRRINLETDAESVFCNWWSMLTVDKDFMPSWRESYFPGGCAHAGELETSAYLYLDEVNVRKELVADGRIAFNEEKSDFHWIDLFAAGPAALTSWTSTYVDQGVMGAADLASKEKGKTAVQEASKQLAAMITGFRDRPPASRRGHHATAPTMAMPWGQNQTEAK
jgi:creatinine amidohydrolase